MNLGLLDYLKTNFNNITLVKRPVVLTPTNYIDFNWIAGFTVDVGNFYVDILNQNQVKNRISSTIKL